MPGGRSVAAWQSSGRASISRFRPHSFDVDLELAGEAVQLKLTGVFALDAHLEEPGTIGARVQFLRDEEPVFHYDLVNGSHYNDAADLKAVDCSPGDGSSLRAVGTVEVDGRPHRLDALIIDLPASLWPNRFRFKDLGSAASFVIAEIEIETRRASGCPFREAGGGVALSELGAIVRMCDRPRFERALAQLEAGLRRAEDLDEARGQALMFLAIASAATLELGGAKDMHRAQLEAARALERCGTNEHVADEAIALARSFTQTVFSPTGDPTTRIIDRALALVERNFAKPLSDAVVAQQLGLSTSHFRFLFRQATGQPFHRYLISFRLERARRLLVDHDMPVSAVADAVGFIGVSHFSRAFSAKFQQSPTSVRRFSA